MPQAHHYKHLGGEFVNRTDHRELPRDAQSICTEIPVTETPGSFATTEEQPGLMAQGTLADEKCDQENKGCIAKPTLLPCLYLP